MFKEEQEASQKKKEVSGMTTFLSVSSPSSLPSLNFSHGERFLTWTPNFTVLFLLSHRELQMKEHPSYEPNHGLSLVKELCWAVLTWTVTWGNCPCPHRLVACCERREKTQSCKWWGHSGRRLNNRLTCWPVGFIKSCGPCQIVLFFICLASI